MRKTIKNNLNQLNFLELLDNNEDHYERRSSSPSFIQQDIKFARIEGMEQMELEQPQTNGLYDGGRKAVLSTSRYTEPSRERAGLDYREPQLERSRNGRKHGNEHDTSLESQWSAFNSIPQRSPRIINTEVFSIEDTSYLHLSKKEKAKNNILAIEALKELESSKSLATLKQKQLLSKYVGFGGIAEIFTDNPSYQKLQTELKLLVSEEEYNDLRDTTSDTFFTNDVLVKSIFKILDHAGYGNIKDLKILEPACGSGNFIGFMPKNYLENAKIIQAIELNSTSAKIANYLYNSDKINISNKSFQDVDLTDNKFDIIIGNFPFGNQRIFDKHSSFGSGKSLHNYFLTKSLESLNDKGLLVAITSTGFLNAKDNTLKKEIDKIANFVGAIRLPKEAFKTANTEALTDIVIFQKDNNKNLELTKELHKKHDYWLNRNYIHDGSFYYNKFDDAKVVGKPFSDTNQFGKEFTNLTATSEEIETSLKSIIKDIIPQNLSKDFKIQQQEVSKEYTDVVPDNIFIGEYFLTEKQQIAKREKDSLEGRKGIIINNLKPKEYNRLKNLIELKEKTKEILQAEIDSANNLKLTALRTDLSNLYSSFKEEFGSLSDNKKLILEDVRGRLVLNLEKKDKDGNITVADIFSKSVINKSSAEIKNLKDAIYYSNFSYGKLNLDYIANLKELNFNGNKEALVKHLTVDSLAYYNPKIEEWEISEKYLSGNVLEKLNDIKDYPCELNLARNIKALNKIMPKAIPFQEIGFSLTTSWLPHEYKEEFICHLMNNSNVLSTFEYEPISDTHSIKFNEFYLLPALNKMQYGTARMAASDIITNILKNKEVAVYDNITEYVNGQEKIIKRINPNETNLALEKQALIETEFYNFISSDPVKLKHVEDIYNKTFNTFVAPNYKASKDIVLANSNPNIKLYEHQRKAVLRGILEGRYLLDHVVGAGKTYTMIATAMERKRLGLCQKPMIIVPNHLVGQWRRAFSDLYPSSNVLTADETNFSKDKRENFVSNMALNEWDCIIMSHSAFEKIPLAPDIIKQSLLKELETINSLLDSDASVTAVKQLKKVKDAYISKLEKITDSSTKDKTLYFNNIGVDELYVDEAHEFKNLQFHTKGGQLKGINPTGSNKAYDLFLKKEYIQSQKKDPSQGLFLATGTPLSNSLAELYTISRYMDNNNLYHLKLNHFDCWASSFANITDEWQVSNTGVGFNKVRMFSSFKNIPELAKMYSQYADLVKLEDLKTVVNIPKLTQGKHQNILAEPTLEQKEYMLNLIERMETIKQGSINPKDDNALKVCNDGRASALDLRIKEPTAEPSNKLKLLVDNVIASYQKYHEDKGTQLIFCDLSTPKTKDDFSIYYDIKNNLINNGIKPNEIAFIHSADNDEKRIKLFEQVNKGEVRVLIGSSIKMGAGMNVQERLVALHHLDAPWRPTDLEQREGRIIRQGNKLLEKYGDNFEVSICRYATNNMYDSRLWQILENKAKFIQQFKAGNIKLRTGEDISENEVKSVEEMKAIASGNPYFLLYIKLQEEHKKQDISHKRQLSNINQLKLDIKTFEESNNIQYNNIVTKITKYENALNSNNIPKYSFTVTQNANYQYIIKENKTDLLVFSSNAEPSKQTLDKRTNQEIVDKIFSNQITILKEQKYNIELNIKSAKESVLFKPHSNSIASLAQDILNCKKALESFHDNPTYWVPKSKGFDKEIENINQCFGKNNYVNTIKTLEKQVNKDCYSR